jgi:putative transcriptional regulator
MASFARQLTCLLVAATLAASSMAGERVAAQRPEADRNENLTGWLLVAAPRMRDPRFSRAVIFLAHHDDKGAFGLIVNRLISVRPAAKLLGDILGEDAPDGNGGDEREIRIHYGGPVQPTHWNFIHSNDYTGSGTIVVTPKVSLTRNQEILRALANGKGPAKGFLAIGYAGWGPGQLEGEIKRKSWITVGPDDGIIFDNDMETKWQRAMDKRGVEL